LIDFHSVKSHSHQVLLGLSNSIYTQNIRFVFLIVQFDPAQLHPCASGGHLGSATPDRVTGKCYVRGLDRFGMEWIGPSPIVESAPQVASKGHFNSVPLTSALRYRCQRFEVCRPRLMRCPGGRRRRRLPRSGGFRGIGGANGGGGGTRHNFKHLQDFSLN